MRRGIERGIEEEVQDWRDRKRDAVSHWRVRGRDKGRGEILKGSRKGRIREGMVEGFRIGGIEEGVKGLEEDAGGAEKGRRIGEIEEAV